MTTQPTPAQRKADGKARRKKVPRSSHGEWLPPAHRPDSVELIVSQDADRLPWLIPIRHGRMAESAFAFYRGAAKIMASDLSSTLVTGLNAQLCGDAHLKNFGSYASPERRQVFDVNDFEETLPGPWEWDLKRLATSVVLAGRDNEYDDDEIRQATITSVEAYRKMMSKFAEARMLDIWYYHISMDAIQQARSSKKDREIISNMTEKFRFKDDIHGLSKLAEHVNGAYRIKSMPPLLIPLRDLAGSAHPDELNKAVQASLASYQSTLSDNHKLLLNQFQPVDMALKVGGVGSVGTRCMIVLFQGRDEDDPLFLQIKEATASVLEDHLPKSEYSNHGQRVVEGQRLMQAASDIFLGWTAESGTGHEFYWRQLHDMKGSADIAEMNPRQLLSYAQLCGWTLAHGHARSGDPIAIDGYLGSAEVFDQAVADFAYSYADQNGSDYKAFLNAIESGRIESDQG